MHIITSTLSLPLLSQSCAHFHCHSSVHIGFQVLCNSSCVLNVSISLKVAVSPVEEGGRLCSHYLTGRAHRVWLLGQFSLQKSIHFTFKGNLAGKGTVFMKISSFIHLLRDCCSGLSFHKFGILISHKKVQPA